MTLRASSEEDLFLLPWPHSLRPGPVNFSEVQKQRTFAFKLCTERGKRAVSSNPQTNMPQSTAWHCQCGESNVCGYEFGFPLKPFMQHRSVVQGSWFPSLSIIRCRYLHLPTTTHSRSGLCQVTLLCPCWHWLSHSSQPMDKDATEKEMLVALHRQILNGVLNLWSCSAGKKLGS